MGTLNTRARLTLDDLETDIEADITLSIPLEAVAKLVQFDTQQLGIGDHIYIDPLGDELLISFTLHNERALSGYIHPV